MKSFKPSTVFTLKESILDRTIVEILDHAMNRMKERSVSVEDLFTTLQRGKGVPGAQPLNRHRVRWKKTVRLSIDAVYELLPDRIRIITTVVRSGSSLR